MRAGWGKSKRDFVAARKQREDVMIGAGEKLCCNKDNIPARGGVTLMYGVKGQEKGRNHIA